MRIPNKLKLVAAAATALALAAVPALAADPDPLAAQYKTCSAAGFTVTTAGPTACGANGVDTCISYAVSGGGTPDHAATFLRSEASVVSFSGSASTATCGTNDSVMGLGANLLCHEKLIHWNNQATKASSFTLRVAGKRKAALTSVAMRKGNSQGTCTMTGIGGEETTASATCVNSCGNFDPHQSVRKTEIFKFENCEMTFEFDTTTGAVTYFDAQPIAGSGASCEKKEGPIGDLLVNGGLILSNDPLGNDVVRFGDGWINSGSNSCSTRLIGGWYYTTCW
jgi:hypothetical protein